MEGYIKLRKSLTSKNRKSKSSSKSSSSPPRSTAPEFDLDSLLATQLRLLVLASSIKEVIYFRSLGIPFYVVSCVSYGIA